jgi:hypothetical protein
MILLLIDLPCVYVCFRSVHMMHYKIKNDKQMPHLARLSFLIVTCPLAIQWDKMTCASSVGVWSLVT